MSACNRPLVTAHSGCENSVTNSLASVLAGIQAQADVVEIDIRSSLDLRPVLHHDPCITNSQGYMLTIAEHPYKSIKTFVEQDDKTYTSLEEVMEIVQDQQCILNIDLKDINSIAYIRKAIHDFNLFDSVIISGCEYDWAKQITKSFPNLQVLLNVYMNSSITEDEQYDSFMHTICREAIEVGSCGLNIDYAMCTEALVSYAKKRFLPVSVWTVDSDEDMLSMLEQGVFSITTYRPKRLIELMKRLA